MEHIIYKITNLLNDRFYIGMHSTQNIDDGYFGSGKRIKAEIKKYGKENFRKEILEVVSSRKLLEEREAQIVNAELLQNPLCLNLKNGGEGGWDHIGPEAITKRSKKISETKKGVPLSLEAREATSKGMIGNTNFKTSTRFKGKTCSDEHKRKIAEKNKHMVGERNSQFGTCWVTNGKPIKIKKEQLDEYLKNGYSRGRIMRG